MHCSEALLIHLLGDEASPSDRIAAQTHIARCPSCAGTVDDIDHDHEGTERVLESLASRRLTPRRWVRVALGILAGLQLAVAVPWVFGVNPLSVLEWHVSSSHLVRDGAIGLFVGAAGLLAALKPRYGSAAVIICAVGVTLQVASGAIDEHSHEVNAWFELLHLLTVAILMLTAMVGGIRTAVPAAPVRQPGLRVISRDDDPDEMQRYEQGRRRRHRSEG